MDQIECGTVCEQKFLNEFNEPFALNLSSSKTHIIIVQVKRELIIIVGAEDIYPKPANKTMFMAQAVRYLKKHHSSFDLTTVFYFHGANTPDQITAFERAVQANGGTLKEASSWENIANYINQTKVRVNGKYFIKKFRLLTSLLMVVLDGFGCIPRKEFSLKRKRLS